MVRFPSPTEEHKRSLKRNKISVLQRRAENQHLLSRDERRNQFLVYGMTVSGSCVSEIKRLWRE